MSYSVAWPDAECHQVLPGLFIGGHRWKDNDGVPRDGRHSSVSGDSSWDYVVSAFIQPNTMRPVPQCDTRYVMFDDTEDGLSEDTWDRIKSVVSEVVARWQAGQKVLVRCQAGFNRSGLMMSLVLMRLGFSAEDAIALLRRRRGNDVLINQAFESYVREREDEYRSLDELEQTQKIIAQEWSFNF